MTRCMLSQFNGFIDAPSDGRYRFSTSSDDGSMVFIGPSTMKVTRLDSAGVPPPANAIIGEFHLITNTWQRWLSVEGRVNFVSPMGHWPELKLRSQGDSMLVRIADATGLDATRLMNSRVHITGVGFGIFNLDQRIVLGELFATTARELKVLDVTPGQSAEAVPLVNAKEVQSLPQEEATNSLPVHLRGVVTSTGPRYDRWLSIQDDTRGIFVNLRAISNNFPVPGDFL